MEEEIQQAPLLQDAADPEDAMSMTVNSSVDVDVVYSTRAARWPQFLATCIACLAPLSFGTVLGYSSPTLPELQALGILDTEEKQSWYASVITLGALCGGLIGGFFMEKLGRKGTMIACGVPYVLGWLMIICVGLAKSAVLLLMGRALCGVTMGVVCIVAPTYIAEIATPELRGTLGNLFQVSTTAGVLTPFLLGIVFSWQWLAVACAVIATCMSILVNFIPETPLHLAAKGTEYQTLLALRWLRGTNYDYHEEYHQIVDKQDAQPSGGFNLREMISNRAIYRPILITLGLMVFQQCSGINNFIFYTKPIFASSGYTGDPAIPEVIIGAVQVGATIISVFVMDIAGRRILLCISGSFMALGCLLLGLFYYLTDVKSMTGLGWLPLMSLILYIVAFSIGWGPIPWTQMAELVPTRVKAFASGLAVAVNWTFAFVVTKEFLAMQSAFTKQGAFWVFAGINTVSVVFVVLFVPETKGKSLSEIQHYFENS